MKGDSSDHIMYFQSWEIQVLWSSPHPFGFLALFLVIIGLAIAALLWMLDLWSSHWTFFCGNRVHKMTVRVLLSRSSVVIFRHNPLQYLSLTFGFWPQFLLADDVFPLFTYTFITLETAALNTPNKVGVLVTDAPAKRTPTICKALILALHSVNKQKYNERYN